MENKEVIKAIETIKEYCKNNSCTNCCIQKTCDKYICQCDNSFSVAPSKWRVLDPEGYIVSTLIDSAHLFSYAEENNVRVTQETEYNGDERYYFHFMEEYAMDLFLKNTDLMSGVIETPTMYETIKEYRSKKWNL